MIVKEYIKKLVPYCAENFITFPLWEEGKYIIQMNLWYLIKIEDNSEEQIEKDVRDITLEINKETDLKFDVYYVYEDCPLQENFLYHFNIIENMDNVDNFDYSNDIEEHFNVAIKLLNKLNNKFKNKENDDN